MNKTFLLVGGLAAAVLATGFWWMSQPASRSGSGSAAISVSVPDLSTQARLGERIFDANCAQCHGENAAGSDQGPPLVHRIYEPGHHADFAFVRAVRQGVRRHHWPFGDMPAIDDVSDRDLAKVIAYVRELQRANGIE